MLRFWRRKAEHASPPPFWARPWRLHIWWTVKFVNSLTRTFDNLHSIIDHDRTSHWSSAQTSFNLFVLKTCDQTWATAWCVVKFPIPVLILVPRVLSPARRNTGASASVLRSQNQASRRDHQKRSMRRVLLPFFCISMLIRSLGAPKRQDPRFPVHRHQNHKNEGFYALTRPLHCRNIRCGLPASSRQCPANSQGCRPQENRCGMGSIQEI
jgi:hypothetical protein